MLATPIQRLRFIGLFEGISSIVLFFVAMPLKYAAGQDWAVKIVGSLHGGLFVLFVASVLEVSIRMSWWGWKWILGTAIASIVPGATFVLDAWLKKQESDRRLMPQATSVASLRDSKNTSPERAAQQ